MGGAGSEWEGRDQLCLKCGHVTLESKTPDSGGLGISPDTGSLEQNLIDWASIIAGDITRPERTRYLRAMVSARIDIVSSCPVTDRRGEQATELVRRAVERGEAAPTVPQILDHIIAPLYYHVVFALKVDREYPRRLVGDVLAMVG